MAAAETLLNRSKYFLFRKGLAIVVVTFTTLRYWPATSMQKRDFTQIELSTCSSWLSGQHRQGCLISDPSGPTSVSLVADRDYHIVYFGLALKRRFARSNLGHRHYRLEFNSTMAVDGGPAHHFYSDEETDAEGWTDFWKVSFPRRIAWAKDVKKGQVITVVLDYVRVYAHRRCNEFFDDFAKRGVVEFAILAESDTNWLIEHIKSIRFVAFIVALLILLTMCYLAERELIPALRFMPLLVLGLIFLSATNPFGSWSHQIVPEEYFSNKTQIILNYLVLTGVEILMGFQAIMEAFPDTSTAKKCVIPLLGVSYMILAYVRHGHIADFKDSAHVYSDGHVRVYRQSYFQELTQKAVWLSSLPCLIVSLFATILGRGYSPVSGFLGYMIISWTDERYVLALFSTWKYASDMAIWVLAFLYLTTWKHPLPIPVVGLQPATVLEEESAPINTCQ